MRIKTYDGLDALDKRAVDRTALLTNHRPIVATFLGGADDYAQLARDEDGWSFEYAASDDAAADLLNAARAYAATHGGGAFLLWASRPSENDDRLAAAAGLTVNRELFILEIDLPRPEPVHISTRSFVVGVDDAEWLRVNARAFAALPDQGSWTQTELDEHFTEPWFEAEDFLVHDEDGRMAGFCWTKRHDEYSPPVGEIYVIATDPDFEGRGLGKQLTLAGLARIAEQGIDRAILYVESTNDRARDMYFAMGFTLAWLDRNYAGVVTPTSDPTP